MIDAWFPLYAFANLLRKQNMAKMIFVHTPAF